MGWWSANHCTPQTRQEPSGPVSWLSRFWFPRKLWVRPCPKRGNRVSFRQDQFGWFVSRAPSWRYNRPWEHCLCQGCKSPGARLRSVVSVVPSGTVISPPFSGGNQGRVVCSRWIAPSAWLCREMQPCLVCCR